MKKSITVLFFVLLVFVQISVAQYYYNRAFSFSGVAGDYAATNPGSALSITGNLTVECWVKPAVVTGTPILIQKRLGSSSTGYTLYLSSSKVAFRTNSSTRINGKNALLPDVWTHIAVTYNSASGLFSIYLNGVLDTSKTVAGAAPNADTDSLRMANGFNGPYNGLLDEVRIWNIVRSQSEIQSTMRIPLGESSGEYTGLVASWRANSISAGAGTEEIHGYTAYLRGPATYANLTGYPNSHLAFNTGLMCTGAATGTCVSIPNATILNPTTSLTLECWLYTGNTSTQGILAKGITNYPYRMVKSAGNTFRVFLNGTAPGTGNYGGVIPTNKWTHLSFTYNSATSTYAYYMNGIQTQTGTQAVTMVSNADPVTIGGGPSIVSLDGIVDEVRICNYAKTPDQVLKGMFTSFDQNNEPAPDSTNVTFNFEGTLADYTDFAPKGSFAGTGIIRFTQVYNNSLEFPAPTNRYDAGNFAKGYRIKYAGLTFGASPVTITDSFYFGQSLTISDVNVFAAIHHTYANDISISLKNPAGTTTRVLYPGAGTNNGMHMITIFDDQADSSIGNTILAPFSPGVKPTNTLAVFNSQSSLGWWKLIITDIFPGSDNGTLIGWGIQFNNQVLTGIGNENNITSPFNYELNQNYPNPFNPATTINYSIAKESFVIIKVFDILGREVMVLVNEPMKAGRYSVTMNAGSLASGVYFYRIEAGNFIDVKKMTFLK